MLRAAVKQGTAIGLKAKDQMDRGELLGDDLIMEMVAERLRGERRPGPGVRARRVPPHGGPGRAAGRHPRPVRPRPGHRHRDPHHARCSAAWPPGGSASTAAPTTRCPSPPLINWTCDVCGGEVVQREDDTEEAISRRLELYERQTAPLIEWYRARNQLEIGARHRLARRGDPPDGQGHRACGGRRGAGPDETQRRGAGQDAQGRPGGGRDPRGHPGGHPPRGVHRRDRPGGPGGAGAAGGRLELPQLPRLSRRRLHVAQFDDRPRHPLGRR